MNATGWVDIARTVCSTVYMTPAPIPSPSQEVAMNINPTTYGEACDHVRQQYKATNGLVAGGTFLVRFESGFVAEVDLRVTESGVTECKDWRSPPTVRPVREVK